MSMVMLLVGPRPGNLDYETRIRYKTLRIFYVVPDLVKFFWSNHKWQITRRCD